MDHVATRTPGAALLPLVALLLTACAAPSSSRELAARQPDALAAADDRTIAVSGSAVHYFTTAVIHSEQPVPDGKVQQSTDVILLTGDLRGYMLYHPTSTFDFAAGTLVNTGTQVFSGTVAGSAPVILHDNTFRFTVDLATGATTGEVHLSRSSDAPHPGAWFDCRLTVTGTGMTEAGDGLADYRGTCTAQGPGR